MKMDFSRLVSKVKRAVFYGVDEDYEEPLGEFEIELEDPQIQEVSQVGIKREILSIRLSCAGYSCRMPNLEEFDRKSKELTKDAEKDRKKMAVLFEQLKKENDEALDVHKQIALALERKEKLLRELRKVEEVITVIKGEEWIEV